jgi:hypothetical protein
MRTLGILLPGLCFLCWSATAGADQDKDARAIIDKALQAHGGAAKLAKMQAVHLKLKGTLEIMNMNLKFAMELHVQLPDKIRTNVDLDIMNKSFNIIQGYDGKKAWISTMGQTKAQDDPKVLSKYRDDMYVKSVVSLTALSGKGFDLSPIGEVKVQDKETVGVRVTSKDRPDVSLYFDKKTGLLLKAEHRTREPINMQEVTQEEYYSDYKEADGIPVARKVVIHHDAKLFMEFEVTEGKWLDRIDAAMFAQP